MCMLLSDAEVAINKAVFNFENEETVEVTVLDDGLPVKEDKFIRITLVGLLGVGSGDVIINEAVLVIPAERGVAFVIVSLSTHTYYTQPFCYYIPILFIESFVFNF